MVAVDFFLQYQSYQLIRSVQGQNSWTLIVAFLSTKYVILGKGLAVLSLAKWERQ